LGTVRSRGGSGEAGEAGGDGNWLAVRMRGTEAEDLCVLGTIRGVRDAPIDLTGGVPFLREVEERIEEEGSGRDEDTTFEASVLFGRDNLETLRTFATKLGGTVSLEVEERARGALSARVRCMVGNEDGNGKPFGVSGTVIEMKVSTRRDWTTFSKVLCE
jgi:hypothetical protein